MYTSGVERGKVAWIYSSLLYADHEWKPSYTTEARIEYTFSEECVIMQTR